MSDLVIIFDGTGPFWDKTYFGTPEKPNFLNSFCYKLKDIIGTEYYYRGAWGDDPGTFLNSWYLPKLTWLPKLASTILGSVGADQISGRALAWTAYEKARGNADRVFLIGHSRGGAAAMRFAQMVDPMPIEAMFLFDAVNMTAWSDDGLEKIPKNVEMCFHAMRDPQLAAEYVVRVDEAKKELQTATNVVESLEEQGPPLWVPTTSQEARALEQLPKARERQRRAKENLELLEQSLNYTRSNPRDRIYNWGNCAGRSNEGGPNFLHVDFKGSHGALGGCPWGPKYFPNDKIMTLQVAEWMARRMSSRNLLKAGQVKTFVENYM